MYLGDWLSRHAEITPARLAIVDAELGRKLTWAQFNHRAARLADVLKARFGIRHGDRVALIAQGGTEVFETLFACAKLGAAFVPFNWRLALPELIGIARDCAPHVILYDTHYAAVAGEIRHAATIPHALHIDCSGDLATDDLSYDLALNQAEPLVADGDEVALTDLAMVLYTSGTTGAPKGVMINWQQVLFNAINTVLACDLTPDDRCLAFLPLFHTGGINCLATPLFHRGGAVVLMPKFDAAQSLDLMERYQITSTVAVPAMYQMLLEAGLADRPMPHLRTLLCGGAPCPVALIERYLELGYNFRQGYGLTEVGPNCFSLLPEDVPHKLGSVGRPTFHGKARVVTDDGAEAAPDAIGELWLKGPHVTMGYLNNPEATAAVLDADGWFHTGDYVRRDADGYFSIAGRKKDMFISGGENVYPAEVENVLATHPAILEVSVVGVPDPKWGEVGAALIQAREGEGGEALEPGALKAWTRARLAAYKVPKQWRVVDELPKNSSGKVIKPEVKTFFV